jgi:hypothetical protein
MSRETTIFLSSPNGAQHISPGHRPGSTAHLNQALKGRYIFPTYEQ